MGYITKGSFEPTKALKTKLFACLLSGVIFLTIAALTFILDPIVLIAKYVARAEYGTKLHESLLRETDSVHISAYLFNITNAEQFLSGEDENLKVEEIGPFTYQENRTNEDFEIDNVAGVIRYTPRLKVTFLPEESVGDPKDIIVTMPNLAMLTMGTLANSYGYLAQMGFNMLTAQLRSNATVTMSAYDYLWGYDDPIIKVGNNFLPGWINFDRLGLLDRLYENKTIRLEVSSRNKDKFMIKTVNGIGGLKEWGYEDPQTRDSCNSFVGSYEGLSYPPEMTPDRPIKIYRSILCRFLELDYQGTRTSDFGVEGLFYKISNRTYKQIPENQCLCSKGICHEGVSDMSPCLYGLPIVLSNGHFLGADPAIYKRIEGMTPNEEDHGSGFTIEPTVGLVMTTKFSIQVSVMVGDVDFNHKIKRFSNMFVPFVHLKIVQPKMVEDRVAILRLIHVHAPYILLASQVLLITAGLLLLAYSARLLYWNWIYAKRAAITLALHTKGVREINEPLMR